MQATSYQRQTTKRKIVFLLVLLILALLIILLIKPKGSTARAGRKHRQVLAIRHFIFSSSS